MTDLFIVRRYACSLAQLSRSNSFSVSQVTHRTLGRACSLKHAHHTDVGCVMEKSAILEQRLLWASVFAENVLISYATYIFCCDFVATKRVTRSDYDRLGDLSIDE